MEGVEDVVIVGAGIAGLATAVALKRVGIRAVVLERSEGLRATGGGLTLFPNAWLALEALDVAQKLTSVYCPTNRIIMTYSNGVTQEVPMVGTSRGRTGPTTVHRKALLQSLSEELPNNTIRFSSKLAFIESHKRGDSSSIVSLQMDDRSTIKTKILIGCDGVNSVVAQWLGLGRPVSSGRFAVRGLAVYPQGHGLSQEFRQYYEVGTRGGFVPLSDKELYWFVVSNKFTKKGDNMAGKNPEWLLSEVIGNLAKNFPPNYIDVFQHSDLSTLTSATLVMRLPWDIIFRNIGIGTVTLAGDAMHPMTPDLGQGGCSALEDAVVLGRQIGESFMKHGSISSGDAAIGIEDYAKERRWRAAGLIMVSYLSGYVQLGGNGWWMKFFRDVIFYRYLFYRLLNPKYNCGKLPKVSSGGNPIDDLKKA